MKKNGFTLVELIAVIVILGLVLSIAYTGVSAFIDRFKERQHDNVIKGIEDAASKYAFDTGETMVFVEKLITEGYYEVDNDASEVKDPKTDENLNCYVVEMTKQSTYYIAKFKSDTKYEKNDGSCDEDKIKTQYANIDIEVYNNGVKVSNPSNWLKGNNITLKATSNSITIDCNNNECNWTSTSGIKKSAVKEITIANAKLLKSKYIFQYSVYNNTDIKRYSKSIDLKIDNEEPIIHLEDTIIYNKNENTPSKDVEIIASDVNGSGIAGYYIGTSSNCNSVSYTTNNRISVAANNNYTICVKDKVGNIGKTTINVP